LKPQLNDHERGLKSILVLVLLLVLVLENGAQAFLNAEGAEVMRETQQKRM
jgi:hypothetical protein